MPVSITFGRVEVGAAALESMADQTDCFITIGACAVAVAETHASNPDCRDLAEDASSCHFSVRSSRAGAHASRPFSRLGVIIPLHVIDDLLLTRNAPPRLPQRGAAPSRGRLPSGALAFSRVGERRAL